ncbi:MAG: DMT family transporter [Sphingomonas fennica]
MAIAEPAPAAGAENRAAGIGYRILCILGFSVMGLTLKLAANHGADLPTLMFARSGFALILILGWLAAGPGLGTIATKRPFAHLGRATLGTIGMIFVIEALVMLPIAEATTITFTAPMFATLLSAVVLKEAVGIRRWTAVAIGFAGVLVVARPGAASDIPPLGAALAILAAIFSGAVAITVRQMGRTETVGATVFWFMAAAGGVGLLAMPWATLPRDPIAYAYLALAGVGGAVGQIFMTASLRHAPVAVLAPFDYLQIVLSILFGWAIWHEVPTPHVVAGAAMIAGGGVWTAWREHRLRRERVSATPPEG